MSIPLSHITALEELRRLAREDKRLPKSASRALPQTLNAQECLDTVMRALPYALQPCPERQADSGVLAGARFSHPIDVLVPSDEARRNTASLRCHTWSNEVPYGAFLELSRDLRLSSPEFVFLQMADSLSITQLIQLGYELCGGYVLDPSLARGWTRTARPLTTPERISEFVAKAPVCRGRKKARRAARFVLANSWSPMETDLSILLTLPTRSGGYQMPAPLLNREIKMTGEQRIRAHHSRYYLDLSWEDRNSRIHALEYQGYEDHSGARALGQDRMREIILDELGIHHIAITEYQVFRIEAFDTVVKAICKSIGRKYRKPTPDQMGRKRKLHRELFARFGPDALVS